jgi:hypothetical protein
VLDWSTGVYNPDVEISRDTTTLYASDRDVFLFLVDDHNPIEAGRLGITRLARDKTQQDARLDMEGRAKKLLDRVG